MNRVERWGVSLERYPGARWLGLKGQGWGLDFSSKYDRVIEWLKAGWHNLIYDFELLWLLRGKIDGREPRIEWCKQAKDRVGVLEGERSGWVQILWQEERLAAAVGLDEKEILVVCVTWWMLMTFTDLRKQS